MSLALNLTSHTIRLTHNKKTELSQKKKIMLAQSIISEQSTDRRHEHAFPMHEHLINLSVGSGDNHYNFRFKHYLRNHKYCLRKPSVRQYNLTFTKFLFRKESSWYKKNRRVFDQISMTKNILVYRPLLYLPNKRKSTYSHAYEL